LQLFKFNDSTDLPTRLQVINKPNNRINILQVNKTGFFITRISGFLKNIECDL